MLGKFTKRFLASLLAVSMAFPGSTMGTLQTQAEGIAGIVAGDVVYDVLVTPNKEALRQTLASVEDLKEETYTVKTWKVFMQAKETAEAVNEDLSAKAQEVAEAAEALNAAAAALKEKVNVAWQKPVSGVGNVDSKHIDTHANDGNASTYWDAGQYAERPWIVIDLQGIYEVDSVNVVNYYNSARFYNYEVYTSIDGEEYTLVAKKNDRVNATENGTTHNLEEPVLAGYVKFVGTHNSANGSFHLNELRVYGELQEETERPTRIACVGDSLTEGMTSSGGNKGPTAYPAYLQQMLGEEYEVRNFGKSSMTLLKDTDKSYWNTTEFADSLAFQPDVVIIMLGSNDSKAKYWNEEAFREDALSLVDEYKKLDTNPRIIFAVSAQVFIFEGADITAAGVETMVAVQRALVEEQGWESIDMYELTEGKEALNNTDKLHFTDSGYYYLAQCMYGALTGESLRDSFDDSRDIPVDAVKVTAGDNQNGEGPERVVDGESATLWHTDWYGTENANHWIQFELTEDYKVDGIRYQPRQTGKNGIISAYEVLVSNDGETWNSTAEGSWNVDALWKQVSFEAQEVKFVRLVAKAAHSDNDYVYASAAEIRLTGEKVEVTPTPTETEAPQPTGTPGVKEEVTTVFTDVYNDWYTDYVQYVYDNGLMTGIKGTTQFQPNANITKAQVAQVLYNMEGQPGVTEKSVFTDLKDVYEAEWYAAAVAWAYGNSIVTGDLNTKEFSPNADVTREQLALMMFRYAKFKEYDVTATSDYEGLVNADKVNSWAAEGMRWAVGAGLISGIEKDGVKDLAPQGNATRAQVAAILQRFCENAAK